MDDAACAELDEEDADRLFFCGRGQRRLADQARAICAGCEVQGSASSSPSDTGGLLLGQSCSNIGYHDRQGLLDVPRCLL
jgi:hypothetical protein